MSFMITAIVGVAVAATAATAKLGMALAGRQKRIQEQKDALDFIRQLLNAHIKRIALENPVGVISSKIKKPDQIIQPWMFGHGETKATCLWLKGLPKLIPTDVREEREAKIHAMGETKNRWKLRSITYHGIANAMAAQWG